MKWLIKKLLTWVLEGDNTCTEIFLHTLVILIQICFFGIWNCKVFQSYHAIKSHCICFCWFCNNFWFSKFWHTRYYLFFLRGKLYLDKDCVYKYCWWKGYVEIHLNHVIWGNLIHIMHNILSKSNQIRIVKLLLYTTPWVYKI